MEAWQRTPLVCQHWPQRHPSQLNVQSGRAYLYIQISLSLSQVGTTELTLPQQGVAAWLRIILFSQKCQEAKERCLVVGKLRR